MRLLRPLFAAKVKAGLTTVSITIDKVGLKVRSLTDTARDGQLANSSSSSNIFYLDPLAHILLFCCLFFFSDVQDAQTYINSYLTVSVTGQSHSQPVLSPSLFCPGFFFFLFDDVCISK